MNADDFDALTFDCYGTLIDWETGLLSALRPELAAAGVPELDDSALLAAFARHEPAIQQSETPAPLYRVVLARVAAAIAAEHGVDLGDDAAGRFAASVGTWPPFPDSREGLARLKERFTLGVISNVDHRSFAGSRGALGDPFDIIVTAEDMGTYKPDLANFRRAHALLAERDIPPSRILHVAESLYHDIAPANQLGLNCVWVDRHAGAGGSATRRVDAIPDVTVHSLAELVEILLGTAR